MQFQEKPSLYARLGGVYNIASIVDDFIDRVVADRRLNANPDVDEAHQLVPPSAFKYVVTEMVCWAAGGPQTYSGRKVDSSHQPLVIGHGEWLAFMHDLQQALDKFEVPQAEQRELLAIVAAWCGTAPRRVYLTVPGRGYTNHVARPS